MRQICILIFTLVTCYVMGQESNLDSEMERLKTETVLAVNSQAIDQYPLWSPNSDFIGYFVDKKWNKVKLTNIKLIEGKWHNNNIGILKTKKAYSLMTKTEFDEFSSVTKLDSSIVVTKDETKIELKDNGNFTISLIITKKGELPKTLWTTGGENCLSLVLSPDEKYVAYLCELNGLFIMKIK